MTTTVISNSASFGLLTNQTIADIYTVNEAIERLGSAVAQAEAGFAGVPGTEFEDGSLFGVAADPAEPGKKGGDYSYAVGLLKNEWDTFWAAALGAINQLDNGVRNP
jgi:hypothetical protein